MERFWGERRFMVPGIVFLAVLAILAALSGTFGDTGGEANHGVLSHLPGRLSVEPNGGVNTGLVAIAAVIAAGIAGYPLGLVLYIPFALVFRFGGGYRWFVAPDEFCRNFLDRTVDAAGSRHGSALRSLRGEAQRSYGDPQRELNFYAAIYERFAPEAVDRRARGRWETMHTSGGMISAVFFAIGLSPLPIIVIGDGTPWWDDRGVLTTVSLVAFGVIALLLGHGWMIGTEAGDTEKRWSERFLDLVERRPEVLEVAALDNQFNDWALSKRDAENDSSAGAVDLVRESGEE